MIAFKTTSTIINWFFVVAVAFFLLDSLTPLEIKSQFLKSFAYLGLIIGAPIVIIWNLLYIKPKQKKITSLILPTLTLIIIIVLGPLKILFSSGAWHTQNILYRNWHSNFAKIEYQMQDAGTFGYNRRTVQVSYLTKFFMIVGEVPDNIEKSVEWIKVDKDVNELELK